MPFGFITNNKIEFAKYIIINIITKCGRGLKRKITVVKFIFSKKLFSSFCILTGGGGGNKTRFGVPQGIILSWPPYLSFFSGIRSCCPNQ